MLKGLESYVDDNGVGKNDLALIAADVFPRDLAQEPSGTLRSLQTAMDDLEAVGLLHRYEHDGTKLLYIAFWEQVQYVQRPARGRLRRPDGTLEYGDSDIKASIPEGDRNPPEPSGPKQVSREAGKQVSSPSPEPASPPQADDRFEEFWDSYDKKVGRKKAHQKYRLALKKPDVTADTLIVAADKYVAAQKADGKHPEFTKDPATWLTGEHWEDQPLPRPSPLAPTTSWMDNT